MSYFQRVDALDPETRDRCFDNDIEAENLYLSNGVDPENHNFTDEKGKLIKLDALFWVAIWEEKPLLVNYVIEQIKEYNGDIFYVKKKKEKK